MPYKLYMGPGQLYQDLQNLIHDLSLVNQIAGMIGSLKGNYQGWFFADDDGNQIKKQKHPLLLRQMPVVMSKLQEFKETCVGLAQVRYLKYELDHTLVASCTNQMGQIAIVAMQNSSPKVTECFNVESRILCMAYVPAEQLREDGEKLPESSDVSPAKTCDTPTVCLGMEEGRYNYAPTHGKSPENVEILPTIQIYIN
ncbi:hypothetical protein XENOCAPTIV_009211 [Xenoophorus captivus]|uniref:Uncharacterized protein n=1 Tax=Xenoophorus captivus TaxID=1517983 RepID=A0ABV0RKL8_9TELE